MEWLIQREQSNQTSYLTEDDTFDKEREKAKLFPDIVVAGRTKNNLQRTLQTPNIYILRK